MAYCLQCAADDYGVEQNSRKKCTGVAVGCDERTRIIYSNWNSFFFLICFYFMHMCVLPASMSVHHFVCSAHTYQKRASDHLGLHL